MAPLTLDNSATIVAKIPKPATSAPPDAGVRSAVGSQPRYALEDHTHEVRARRRRVTLAAGTGVYAGMSVATWVFDKPFATKPIIVCSPEGDTTGQPVVVNPIANTFVQNADGLWVSVMVRGVRSRPIPTNLVSLLLQGVYDLFGGSANGVVVGLTAAEETPTTT